MKRRPARRLIYWLPAVTWALLIAGLSHLPGDDLPSVELPFADKLVHAGLYAVLTAFTMLGFRRAQGSSPVRAAVYAFCVACIYGAIDEYHQSFVDHRSTSIVDWIADVAGAALASVYARHRAVGNRP